MITPEQRLADVREQLEEAARGGAVGQQVHMRSRKD
jgi:hypothetical protein